MRSVGSFIFALLIVGALAKSTRIPGREESIVQKIDHFAKDSPEFETKYYVHDDHYVPGGPIIISLMFSKTNGYSLRGNYMEEIAQSVKGYLVETHTRKNDPDLQIDLKYQTLDQIFGDFKTLIDHVRSKLNRREKVIIIARYELGSVATWFRIENPDHCDGVWAAETPLLAQFSNDDFFNGIGEWITKHGSQECYNRLQQSFVDVKDLFKTKQQQTLKSKLDLCSDFEAEDDQVTMMAAIMKILSIYRNWTPESIKSMCTTITDQSIDSVTVFSTIVKRLKDNIEQKGCIPNTYSGLIDSFKETSNFYFMCNELGGFRTTSPNQPFAADLTTDTYAKLCADAFGTEFTKDKISQKMEKINNRFGGLHPKTTNLYFTTGGLNPLKSFSAHEVSDPLSAARIVPGVERAWVFQSIAKTDNDDVRQAQVAGLELIHKWVQ